MFTIDELVLETRRQVGDIEHSGNTTTYVPQEVIDALNWAQDRYAEITHATYAEGEVEVGEEGILDLLEPDVLTENGILEIDRIVSAETSTDPVATITCAGPFSLTSDMPLAASVPVQVGATFCWQIAGGSAVSTTEDGEAVAITPLRVGALFISCVTTRNGKTARGSKTVTIVT